MIRSFVSLIGLLTLLHSSKSLKPSSTAQTNNQLMALRPINVQGKYRLPSGQDLDSVFLGRKDLDVISSEDSEKDDEVLVCDLVPLLLTRRPFSDPDQFRISVLSPNPMVNRDRGFYDSLPFTWAASRDGSMKRAQDAKKAIFDKCSIVKGNPGVALLKAMKDVLDAEVRGLFIEVVDEYGGDAGGVVLGSSAIVAQGDANKYRISRKSDAAIRSVEDLRKLPISKPWLETNQVDDRVRDMVAQEETTKEENDDAVVTTVTCHLDEVVGLSRSLDMPIWMPRGLFDKVCEDVRLTKSPMLLSAPSTDRKTSTSSSFSGPKNGEDGDVDTVWTIYNPKEFVGMSAVRKRDLLRASGARSLPRPREGKEALDAVLVDLMDAAVRSEFQRLSSSTPSGGDAGGSERAALLRRMGEALENDDLAVATSLRKEFAFKTALRADPTQEVGSYDPYLDQDDWYAEARRKAMQPKEKKNE